MSRGLPAISCMPGAKISATGFLLQRRPATEKFEQLVVFSAEHGVLRCLKRIPSGQRPAGSAVDLFDEVQLELDPARQGDSYFVNEARVLRRHTGIATRYEALVHASAFALLLARNPLPEESRSPTYALLSLALAAWTTSDRPEVVFLKSLYKFAREEGYPVKEEWLAGLAPDESRQAAEILRLPLGSQTSEPAHARRLAQSLESYLRTHTELYFE